MVDISIIVPVYNVYDKLNDCLESIYEQSYRNYECILVDDGSTDGSSQIIDEYVQRDCIFRKNCASVPEERSAIPLQTEQSSAG